QARQEAVAALKETDEAKILTASAWDNANTAKRNADLAWKEVKSAKKDAETAWKETDRLTAQIQSIKHSYSYRIGRTVTCIPRKVRNALKKKDSGKS
ncbi:MAG: hypothetical protein LUE27_08840, partial [Clostridia bacterium]|nr:hypothetical protein [Clostridia bacterium]